MLEIHLPTKPEEYQLSFPKFWVTLCQEKPANAKFLTYLLAFIID